MATEQEKKDQANQGGEILQNLFDRRDNTSHLRGNRPDTTKVIRPPRNTGRGRG